jgi:hypothetical protein
MNFSFILTESAFLPALEVLAVIAFCRELTSFALRSRVLISWCDMIITLLKAEVPCCCKPIHSLWLQG